MRIQEDNRLQSTHRLLSSYVHAPQYMDRIYVRHQNKTPVHQLGLDLWRDLVIYDASIEGRLRSNLLDFVNRERNGELIDQSLIKSITTVSPSSRNLMTRSCLSKCLLTISGVACASVCSVLCLAKISLELFAAFRNC